MCGIAGIVGPDAAWFESALARMTRAQQHRGPDDQGLAWAAVGTARIGFGHRRLAIQDPSTAGHQPMAHPETGDLLVFNGEIYNAPALARELRAAGVRFRGHSDTEVLLHGLRQWGTDCLGRLEGMYAFAWLDRVSGSLLLARDPLGIKPLYVSHAGGRLFFASEVRALLATGQLSDALDQRGLSSLLAYGSTQAPWTLFRAIEVLPAGHWQRIGLNCTGQVVFDRSVPHWRFPAARLDLPFEDAAEAVREQLSRSVRSHLLSDVPVAVFLSSGLDSTLVAGLAARQSKDICACTVGFSDAPDQSEGPVAAETARAFGLPHDVLWLEQKDALDAVLPWLDALDQPSMDGLNTFMISRRARAAGFKVALSGQGGDELFGGYPSFADVPALLRGLRWLDWLPAGVRARLASVLSIGGGLPFREKLADMLGAGADLSALSLQRRRCFSNARIRALLGGSVPEPNASDGFIDRGQLADLPIRQRDAVHGVSLLESRFYLGNTLLPVGDSTGMAHGLEIRVPMLDRPLLDLALSLPGAVRLPKGKADKSLLRRGFPDLLRPALLRQSKRGFVIPVRRWMKGELRQVCETALDVLRAHPQFNEKAVSASWNHFLAAPESPMWSRVWLLVALGWYLRRLSAVSEY